MNILCIDLKSFYASCECVERGLDPNNTPLVVANPHQGQGAITLAITPYLRNKGIKSRSRLYEIPKHINYFIVPPRLNLYSAYSKKVVDVYLKFVAREDILVYSIDECFIDLTNYLKLYKKTDYELTKEIMNKLEKELGLMTSAGLGPNMFLAKVALDIEAKKEKHNIAKITKEDIPDKIWNIAPINRVWGIGKSLMKKLNNMGIFNIYDLAHYDPNILQKRLGVMGKHLWENVNGITNMTIQEENNKLRDKTISHSKMFITTKSQKEAMPTIIKLVDSLIEQLKNNNLEARTIFFAVNYDYNYNKSFKKRITLEKSFNDYNTIINFINDCFKKQHLNLPIRQVIIRLSNLNEVRGTQLNLFEDYNTNHVNDIMFDIKHKYGRDSIKKAVYLIDNKKTD